MKEVDDGVFSEGILGDGLAIIPENEILYAPADGTVTILMEESRHACGLQLENGMVLLLHIGLDTVSMNGDGFEYLISAGQKVRAGEPLIRFDREKIRAAGHRDVTMCIIAEQGNAGPVQILTGMCAKECETVIMTVK